jgi:hypothetical protein
MALIWGLYAAVAYIYRARRLLSLILCRWQSRRPLCWIAEMGIEIIEIIIHLLDVQITSIGTHRELTVLALLTRVSVLLVAPVLMVAWGSE